jgi:hypothetical protein
MVRVLAARVGIFAGSPHTCPAAIDTLGRVPPPAAADPDAPADADAEPAADPDAAADSAAEPALDEAGLDAADAAAAVVELAALSVEEPLHAVSRTRHDAPARTPSLVVHVR